MFFKIFVQVIGFIGAAFGFIAYQNNNHKKIMIFKTASELTFALQFVLLHAYTGMAMNLIGCTRNLVFADRVKKGKSTAVGIVVFSAMMAAAGALTWVGPISLLAILGKIASTLAYGMKSPKLVRLLTLPSSALWIIYDAVCLSAAGVLTEVFTVVSITIAEIRFRKKKVDKTTAKESLDGENTEVEEKAVRNVKIESDMKSVREETTEIAAKSVRDEIAESDTKCGRNEKADKKAARGHVRENKTADETPASV